MEIISTTEEFSGGPIVSDLIDFLESKEKDLELTKAKIYIDFPIYRDEDFNLYIARLLITSPNIGIICIWTSEIKSIEQELETYKKDFDDAEQIYVGKAPNNHAYNQEEINELLVKKALEGKVVARLKGGDPFVFGRGGKCL